MSLDLDLDRVESLDSEPVITPVFKTPMPDGPFRYEIVVEILSLDGKDFVGTITPTEARKVILEEVLGFTQEDLAGITIGVLTKAGSSSNKTTLINFVRMDYVRKTITIAERA